MGTLSIIMPTFNEERTIEAVIRRLLAVRFPVDIELILVDDHSTDQTVAVERRLAGLMGDRRVTILRNRVNKGKGACIRQGLKHASGEWVTIQDADLEYDPQDLPALLAPLRAGEADAVYGSRFLARRWPRAMAWPNYAANRLLTALTNAVYGTRLTDMETCYKVLRRDVLRRLRLRAERFEFEPEVTAQLARLGCRIVERPIRYEGRTRQAGKKIRAKDFFIALRVLLMQRMLYSP